MRKIVSMKIVAMLVMALALPTIMKAESITYTATYDYSKLSIGTDTLGGVTYTTVRCAGCINNNEPGMPSLPIHILHFSVPFNASNFTISATCSNHRQIPIPYLVYPAQKPKSLFDNIYSITSPDSSVYSMMTYPLSTDLVRIVDDDFLAGENHIVTLAIMPISIMSNGDNRGYGLQFADVIGLTLHYELSDSLTSYPMICHDSAKRAEGYEYAKSIVVNPDDVNLNAPSSINHEMFLAGSNRIPSLPEYFVDSLDKSETDFRLFDYIIITPDSLHASLKRLSAFKKQKGHNVGIITVDEIIHNPLIDVNRLVNDELIEDDQDYPTIIRLFLTYTYVYGKAKYVLLSGRDVPSHMNADSAETDQYYCDLSSNWYSTSRFSSPELFIGRIIAKNDDQIANYSDKLLRYELNPGNGDYSYLRRALYTNGYDQHVDNETFTDMMKYYTDSIFPISTTMAEDRQQSSPYPTGVDIVDEINRTQYGFIGFNNHGIPTGIVTYGRGNSYRWLWADENIHAPESATHHVNNDSLSGNGLNNMANKYYPNICFSTCCSVMPFSVRNGYDPSWMNFGESFTTGKDYGGPAFMGNTSENGFEMANLCAYFARNLYEGFHNIGIAYCLAKVKSYSYYNASIHNLLGDPEFEVWTDIPQLYSNIGITRTNNSISINGIGADSTIVAYYSNDGQIGTDTISTSSVTLDGISPNSSIMLYKHNYIPYIMPLELQNTTLSNSQYVIAGDVCAGNSIDSNRTSGDVVVQNGVEYEIEASGTVRLEGGFKVEKGATLAVYPSCF